MDIHTSVPPSSKRMSHSRGSQRSRGFVNPPSIYTNPSPVTSRGDSPTNLRSQGLAGTYSGYSGPYRMTPGKSQPPQYVLCSPDFSFSTGVKDTQIVRVGES